MSKAPISLVHTKKLTLIKSNLSQLFTSVEDGASDYTIVASLGCKNIGKSTLLNVVFGTGFEVGTDRFNTTTKGIDGMLIEGSDIVVLDKPQRDLVLFDVEAFDSGFHGGRPSGESSVRLATAVSDVIVLHVHSRDVGRLEATGLPLFKNAIEDVMKLRSLGVLSSHSKKLLVVVFRDVESEETNREDLITAFIEDCNSLLGAREEGSTGIKKISDLFDIEFALFPHYVFHRQSFERTATSLRERFREPTSDDYFFIEDRYSNPTPAMEISLHITQVWERLGIESYLVTAPEYEMNATFHCDNCFEQALTTYFSRVREWKRKTEEGRIIQNFGKESTELRNEILALYDDEAAQYKGTKAFERKRKSLLERVQLDLYTMYSKLLNKLKEVSFDIFRESLSHIQISDNVEKDVNKAIKAADKYFCSRAELLKFMRENATERLQLARIQGAYVPPARMPISLSLNYLHPNPFGKDSRYEDFQAEKEKVKFDPGNTRRGGIMEAMLGGKDKMRTGVGRTGSSSATKSQGSQVIKPGKIQ
ncbi:Protein SEY1 [Galdieria sulphuraria]|nr:Protein SEY1 [Galdieria sulphuraria]